MAAFKFTFHFVRVPSAGRRWAVSVSVAGATRVIDRSSAHALAVATGSGIACDPYVTICLAVARSVIISNQHGGRLLLLLLVLLVRTQLRRRAALITAMSLGLVGRRFCSAGKVGAGI